MQRDYERVLLLPRGRDYRTTSTTQRPRAHRARDEQRILCCSPKIPPGFPRGLHVDRIVVFATIKKPTRGERYDNFIPCRKIWKNNERDVENPTLFHGLTCAVHKSGHLICTCISDIYIYIYLTTYFYFQNAHVQNVRSV